MEQLLQLEASPAGEFGKTEACKGCMHGTVRRIIREALRELHEKERVVAVIGSGCAENTMGLEGLNTVRCARGRAGAVATGIKRTHPELLVFTCQSTGYADAIGLAETVSAANRGEHITVFFINNAIADGRMTPTTPLGLKTETCPEGRNVAEHGAPMHVCELLNRLTAPAYIARVSTVTPEMAKDAKEAVKKALTCQIDGIGYAFVEFVTNCPKGWHQTDEESVRFVTETLLPVFKPGELRVKEV